MSEVERLIPGLDTTERAIAPWLIWEYYSSGENTTVQKLQAAEDVVAPFFLLLDEMNLAHVEHYFADFLSVLESGRRENGFTREEIRLHSFAAPVKDAEGRAIPPTLALPPNLYIVGTVNVDETTHAFSPKVLDRAFTIEFEAADLESYPALRDNASATLTDDQRSALLRAFVRGNRFIRIDKAPQIAGGPARDSEPMRRLRALEQLLRPYELHFGYRIVDEILAYLANAEEYGWFEKGGGLEAAFDSAVLMKVLPKFHGPRARLKDPLHEILKWTGMPDFPDETPTKAATYQETIRSVQQTLVAAPDYSRFHCPRTALKCLRMLYQLSITGFASFS
jgi:5-methylcytosine-specific restriction endonuclease McrBC GTP-binding regulatory subunit McrB